jgi:hypothetical protein
LPARPGPLRSGLPPAASVSATPQSPRERDPCIRAATRDSGRGRVSTGLDSLPTAEALPARRGLASAPPSHHSGSDAGIPPLRGRGTGWRAKPARRLLPRGQERGSTPSWLPPRNASVSDVFALPRSSDSLPHRLTGVEVRSGHRPIVAAETFRAWLRACDAFPAADAVESSQGWLARCERGGWPRPQGGGGATGYMGTGPQRVAPVERSPAFSADRARSHCRRLGVRSRVSDPFAAGLASSSAFGQTKRSVCPKATELAANGQNCASQAAAPDPL